MQYVVAHEESIEMENAEENDLADEGMMTHTTNVKCMRMSRWFC